MDPSAPAMTLLICHLFGDYVFQTDHMATNKRASTWVALWHGLAYTLPFLLLNKFMLITWPALAVIMLTHVLIDRFGLARYLVWAKNQVAPKRFRYSLGQAMWHGYQADKPLWLAGWLFIAADNAMHILANFLAYTYL